MFDKKGIIDQVLLNCDISDSRYAGYYSICGLAKSLFPEIAAAFRDFAQSRSWSSIEQAVDDGYNTGKNYAETISSIYKEGKQKNNMDWVKDEITKCLPEPLV